MLVPSAVHIRDRSKMAQRWGKWIWDQDGFRGLDRWHLHVTHLSETDETEYHLCWGLSSHRFPVVRDGHHPTSTGVYTTTMRTPYLRWDDHPQYHEFRPWHICGVFWKGFHFPRTPPIYRNRNTNTQHPRTKFIQVCQC